MRPHPRALRYGSSRDRRLGGVLGALFPSPPHWTRGHIGKRPPGGTRTWSDNFPQSSIVAPPSTAHRPGGPPRRPPGETWGHGGKAAPIAENPQKQIPTGTRWNKTLCSALHPYPIRTYVHKKALERLFTTIPVYVGNNSLLLSYRRLNVEKGPFFVTL